MRHCLMSGISISDQAKTKQKSGIGNTLQVNQAKYNRTDPLKGQAET